MKEIPLAKCYRLINPGPCVLVSSGSGDKVNVAPVAWTSPINDEPPMVAITLSDSHYTTELIQKSGEFVINIPPVQIIDAVMSAGAVSGRKADKFAPGKLTPEPGIKVRTPHIKECVGFIECKVRDHHTYDGVIVFIADVLYAAADAAAFDETWIPEQAQTVHHLGGSYFAVLGKRFKA